MRSLPAIALLVLACTPQTPPHPPPSGEFYYPTGLAFVPFPDGGQDGILYVASFNLDKRYDQGSLIAVNLANVVQQPGPDGGLAGAIFGLPPLGTPVDGGELLVNDLMVADGGMVSIQSFAGEVGVFPLPGGGARLFIPSRAEGDRLQIIEAAQDQLSCFGNATTRDCASVAPSLTALVPPGDAGLTVPSSQPRAPQPFGVGVSTDGWVYVTHLQPADDPINSGKNNQAYLVRIDAHSPVDPGNPSVSPAEFIQFPHDVAGNFLGTASSVTVGARYAYVSGRFVSPNGVLVRTFDPVTWTVSTAGAEFAFDALEARGIAVNEAEGALYLVTRSPDSLLSIQVSNDGPTATGPPLFQELRAAPLPQGPNEARIISRKGLSPPLGDLVVVTCATANSVVFYDADLGTVVKDFPQIGFQPFDAAIDNRGSWARVYVSAFAESRVLVFDVPLAEPESAFLVARLGTPDTCFTTPRDPSCPTLPSGGFVP